MNGRVVTFWWLLAAVVVLLGGVALRTVGLAEMSAMVHHDEAYNALDAASLLDRPRLQVYFSGNYGREAAWLYWLAPWFIFFGQTSFALRLAATMTGVLTLAATYALARRLSGRASALWATAALGVLYWHMHVSHLALRALLFLLVGTLAFAVLLRARHRNSRRDWLLAGALAGLLAYTYYAAWFWLAVILLVLVWWMRQRRYGREALYAGLTALAVTLPMVLYRLSNIMISFRRIEDVSVQGMTDVLHHIQLWLAAWFGQGDLNAMFNPGGRPVLDLPLGLLVLAGLVSLLASSPMRRIGLMLLGLIAVSLLPSIFSDNAPHYLRAIGATVPLALLAGSGGAAIASLRVSSRLLARLPVVAVIALLGWAGLNTGRAFEGWLQLPEIFVFMEQHVQRSVSYVGENVPPEMPVYFWPFADDHAVISLDREALAPRPVAAFMGDCFVVSDVPAVYAPVVMYGPDFGEQLARWGEVSLLLQDEVEPPRYAVLQFEPDGRFTDWPLDSTVTWTDAVRAQVVSPLPTVLTPGEPLTVTLAFSLVGAPERALSVFVHLYGDPTPYEGGTLWGQVDVPLCSAYTPDRWKTGETIIQTIVLDVPADTPAGGYIVGMGLYGVVDGVRLPVEHPSAALDWAPVHQVEILAATDTD